MNVKFVDGTCAGCGLFVYGPAGQKCSKCDSEAWSVIRETEAYKRCVPKDPSTLTIDHRNRVVVLNDIDEDEDEDDIDDEDLEDEEPSGQCPFCNCNTYGSSDGLDEDSLCDMCAYLESDDDEDDEDEDD
jgi:hypothetical protein